MLFVRLLSTKNSQKERVDWLELGKVRMKADLSRGYVSTSYLEALENVNNSQNKLKAKSFTMVSFRDSQKQKEHMLRPLD